MSDRNIEVLKEKAKVVSSLLEELETLANENNFGVNFDSTILFDDWLSSDCFGEGSGESFSVAGDNTWYSSNC